MIIMVGKGRRLLLLDYVRPPIPPTRGVLVEDDYFSMRAPSRRGMTRSIFDGMRDFNAEAKWQQAAEELGNGECQVFKKRKTLEDLFRPPLDLIHRGAFESSKLFYLHLCSLTVDDMWQAREKGQAINKWVMVNVQDVREFACQVLNRDVWSHQAVKSIVKEHFIFWQTYCDSEEGRRYDRFYKVTRFPYIAVIDPRTGENLVTWNNVDAVSLCDLMSEFLTQHPSPDGSFTQPKKKIIEPETLLDGSEEDQLKAAIEASIRDMAGTSSSSTTAQAQEDDSDGGESFDSDTKQSEEAGDSWQSYLGADHDPKSELLLRFPDGQKQKMSFPATSQLKALLQYVVSRGFSADEYEVITNFPRKDLSSLEGSRTLQEVVHVVQAMIIMQFDFALTNPFVTRSSSSSPDYVRPPIPPTRGVLVEDDYFSMRAPSRRGMTRSIFDGMRDFNAEAKWQQAAEELGNGECQVFKKRKTLEDLFRPPLDLIHRGAFESSKLFYLHLCSLTVDDMWQAREKGQAINKWVMVNVQDVREFACQVLNRDVWSHQAVKSIVKEHFIFWQTYCDSEEGRRYDRFYKVTRFPYIAVIDPRTGENLVTWNNVDAVSLCDLMSEFLTQHPSPDGSFTQPKKKIIEPVMVIADNLSHCMVCVRVKETLLDGSEEDQLKAAIEASIRDMAGTSSSSTTAQAQEDDSDGGESFDSDTKQSEEAGDSWQSYLGADHDPKSELLLRFPDGQKQKMSFPATSQLKALLQYVVSRGFSADEYEVITNFPRKDLSSLEGSRTLQEVGLYPRETVFIQLKSN
ncbi:UBXN7 [Cordylochernes scorpioides]|uniref:UBXN7 n=1 Tax=Cordylochernes scorpioides TaxID=51811 RepID=A0ABY6K2B1_9ARAC|nr:UBXN7 [Cordylochernes scorpioides]